MSRLFLRCVVPFCPRVRGARKGDVVPMERQVEEGWFFICADHWRPIRAEAKRRHRAAQRALESAEAIGVVEPAVYAETAAASQAVISAAIEIGMGISG